MFNLLNMPIYSGKLSYTYMLLVNYFWRDNLNECTDGFMFSYFNFFDNRQSFTILFEIDQVIICLDLFSVFE